MIEQPKQGQIVSLNDEGMRSIGGLHSSVMIKQAKRMRITKVTKIQCDDAELYTVYVDQPLINPFLISNFDIDLVMEVACLD